METKEKLLAVFLGPLGINHFVRGCYKTGGLKALSSIFLWLTPIPWIWWGMDVGASFLDQKYMMCEGTAMNPEMAKKVGKLFAYASGIAMTAAAAYQAQKFAKKMGGKIPGMGKLGSLAGKIPGGMGRMAGMAGKLPGGMGRMAGKMAGKIPGMGFMRGGGKEEQSCISMFLLIPIILLSLFHGSLKN